MFTFWRKVLRTALAVALVGLVPAHVFARPIAASETCHASAALDESYTAFLRAKGRWICESSRFDASPASLFLRYRLNPALDDARARSFVAQVGPYAAITIWAVDAHGAVRSARYDRAGARHITAGPFMVAPLPATPSAPRLVVVRIDQPWLKTIASHAWLDSQQEGTGWSNAEIVAMALICGMLVAPLLLNLAFYPVLRRSFVLWNVGIILAMLDQALISTGFIHLLVDLDGYAETALNVLGSQSSAACGLMVMATFIEPDCQSKRIRALLKTGASLVAGVCVLAALPFEALRPYMILIAYSASALSVVMLVAAMTDAWRRGSRAVYFLIVGWSPILLVAAYRIGCYLLPMARPTESVVPFQLAVAISVLATASAILC